MPSEDVILGITDPEKIVEEVLFRKFPMDITPEDELMNEQMRHRNSILKVSLDFPLLGVASDKRIVDITHVAINGRVTRTGEAQQSAKPPPQNESAENRLSDSGASINQ